jgi:hypothetical protein
MSRRLAPIRSGRTSSIFDLRRVLSAAVTALFEDT